MSNFPAGEVTFDAYLPSGERAQGSHLPLKLSE